MEISNETDFVLEGTRSLYTPKRRQGRAQDSLEDLPSRLELIKSTEWAVTHFEAFQLILKHQSLQLVQSGFPPEFEVVVKQLWSILVAKLLPNLEKVAPLKRQPVTADEYAQQLLATLPNDNVHPASQTEQSEQSEQETIKSFLPSKRRIALSKRHGLSMPHTILLLHLAAVHLSLPVLLADLQKWAESGKIVYINAGNTLPEPMMERLGHVNMFMPSASPRMSALFQISRPFFEFYHQMGLSFSMNLPLVTARFINRMQLNQQVYWKLMNLCTLVSFSTSYHSSSVRTTSVQGLHWNPEVSLAALVHLVISHSDLSRDWSKRVLGNQVIHPKEVDLMELMEWAISNETEYLKHVETVFQSGVGPSNEFERITSKQPIPQKPPTSVDWNYRQVSLHVLSRLVGHQLDNVVDLIESKLQILDPWIESLLF